MQFEDFPWPAVGDGKEIPIWRGTHFEVGSNRLKILSFTQSDSAWSPELTEMHEREAASSHPIDLASRAMAVESMKLLNGRLRPTILDVGCSSGFLVEDLMRCIPEAEVIGADNLQELVLKAATRLPSNPFLQFDLRECPLPEACIDGVTALNVLEHIADDRKALAEIFRILKPRGIAHIEVPADPASFDLYDQVLLHFRRYQLEDLVTIVRQAGFTIRKATHLGFFLYPIFKQVKRRNQTLGTGLSLAEKKLLVAKQIRTTKNFQILSAVFGFERLLGAFVSYPVGIRVVARLEKS